MTAVGDRAASSTARRPAVSGYFVEGRERMPGGGFWSVDDVEVANRNAGFHFFSESSRRFFSSRVGGTLYAGRFFVTSEADRGPGPRAWDGERRYSLRFARCDASIETLFGFGAYGSSREANRAAARAAHLWRLRVGGAS